MTIQELLDYIDDVRPNTFTEKQKLLWLNELEARVQREVFLSGERLQYRMPEDCGSTPLLDPPHDAIYRYWLEAMIDYANGEYSKYQNTMQMFNAQWSSFTAWFAETYRPADGYRRRLQAAAGGPKGVCDKMAYYENPPYYLTAYGIACKHGFRGTEEEWLKSLTAYGIACKHGFQGTEEEWLESLGAPGAPRDGGGD